MRKHRLMLLILAVAAMLFAVSLTLTRTPREPVRTPREPVYEGKRLSEWLDDLRPSDTGGGIVLGEASVRAVRAIGTNTLPCLLAMLRCSDSEAKMAVAVRVARYRPSLGRFFTGNAQKRQMAVYGFRALGSDARSAFPEIVSLVLASDANADAVNALTSADGTAITLLTRGLAASDSKVRERAAFALGCLRQAPAISVPALTQALSDSDPGVRTRAAGSLGCYGTATNHILTGQQ